MSAISGPEYISTAGRCIARSTSSGIVVGPGMARNCDPLERSCIFSFFFQLY